MCEKKASTFTCNKIKLANVTFYEFEIILNHN